MRMSVDDVAACLGIAPLVRGAGDACGGRILPKAVTDSRAVTPGALFVCVPGARVDGHEFAAAAVRAGAGAVLASRAVPEAEALGAPVFRVADTVAALGRLAACWRERTAARVVCVTGTAGKTTVKEALAAVLARHGRTAVTPLNHNNQIGMPCAVLDTDGDEDFWVMEAGISHEGDMDTLAAILKPDLALILNVGEGHTEGLGEKGVAWHKTRLLNHRAPGGAALVSADYPDLRAEAGRAAPPVYWFSAAGNPADFTARAHAGSGRCTLLLDGAAGAPLEVETPFQGDMGAENAVAVAAAARLLGLSDAEIADGLRSAPLPPQRCNEIRCGAWRVIDDTYNANPLSMRRMLDVAAGRARAANVPLIMVLGEMGELGADSARCHERLGRHLAALAPALVFWKGGHGADVRAGLCAALREAGRTAEAVVWQPVTDAGDFVAKWGAHGVAGAGGDGDAGAAGGVILFKGSRANRLETLLTAFRERIACPGTGEEAAHVL